VLGSGIKILTDLIWTLRKDIDTAFDEIICILLKKVELYCFIQSGPARADIALILAGGFS